MNRGHLSDVLMGGGLVLVVVGFGWWLPPLGVVVAGVVLIGLGVALGLGGVSGADNPKDR